MIAKAWETYRSDIVRLYINDGLKLDDVRAIMEKRFGFKASTRSYRQHFDQWKVGKYDCKKRRIRRQAMMGPRPLLSPPHTPLSGTITPMTPRYPVFGGLHMENVRLPSPESLSSSTRSSSGLLSPVQQRPLPDISSLSQHQDLVPIAPRFHPYFPENTSPIEMHTRQRSAAMGPPPSPGTFSDIPSLVRNPSMSEVIVPFNKSLTSHTPAEKVQDNQQQLSPPITAIVGLSNSNVESKVNIEAEYVSRPTYQEAGRSWAATATHHPAPPAPFQDGEYRLYNTAPREGLAESFPGAPTTPRSMDLRALVTSPNSLSRLS